MMHTIDSLPEFDTVTVIINIDTRASTTLALLSVLRFTKFPVLVIESSKNSDELFYFRKLQNEYKFYIITLPLNIHVKTLDYLFLQLKANNILLMDSDAEILSEVLIDSIPDCYTDDNIFGYGFVHGPSQMTNQSVRGGNFCYYQERMYIPCVLLKTAFVREAIQAGCSFEAKKIYNDFPIIPMLSKLLYFRFYFKFFQRHDICILSLFRRRYNDYYKPSMIYYDTGAEIYMYLKYKLGYDFIGMPVRYFPKYCAHYHGITRKILNNEDQNSAAYNALIDEIIHNLRIKYSFDLDDIKC